MSKKRIFTSCSSFNDTVSDLSEFIHGSSMNSEEIDGAIAFLDSLKEMHENALSEAGRVADYEKSSLQSEVDKLEGVIDEDCVDSKIDTGIGTIGYKSPNLQNQMIMELLEDLIKKNGSYNVLRALETLNI